MCYNTKTCEAFNFAGFLSNQNRVMFQMAKYSIVHSVRVCTEFVPETYGRLTTLGPAFLRSCGRQGKRKNFLECVCTCGKIIVCAHSHLKNGHTQSCGCRRKELAAIRHTTHGMYSRSEYKIWAAMRERCDNPNNRAYPDYGGRGISYCESWKKFENFFADMGEKPSPLHSLDREKNDGNYEKSNCRWVTRVEQNNNTRRNNIIIVDGKSDTLANWCRIYAIKYQLVRDRIGKLGWEPLRALTVPARLTKKTK